MRKFFILAAMAVMLSGAAVAGNAPPTLDVSKLSEDQRIAIMDQVAKARQVAETKPVVAVTPEKVQTYADVGIAVGKALAGAVKELGVEANNFATTPVGMIAVALIVWNVAGDSVADLASTIFVGVPLLTVWMTLWFYVYRRQCLIYRITIGENEKGKKTKVVDFYNVNEMNSTEREGLAWHRLFTIFFGLIGMLVISMVFF